VAGQASQDVLQRTVDAFAQRVNEYAQGIAGRLGQPQSGTELSKDEAVARWNYTPLGSQQAADAQYHQLVSGGMPPGQALDQVYPMRGSLFRGAQDVNASISTAKQVQGWAAEASGQPAVETPQTSTLPMLMAAQRNAQAAVPRPALPQPAAPPPAALPPQAAPASMPPPPAITAPPMGSLPAAMAPAPNPAQLALPLS
jgi:hypothetical protein